MRNDLRLFWTQINYYLFRPILGTPDVDEHIDIYSSKMLTEFNSLHGMIFPRFFSKTRVDKDSLNEARKKFEDGSPIYITTYIGQLEYNFFNYLFIDEGLPLAEYSNGLSNWQWMPFERIRHTKTMKLRKIIQNKGVMPNAVASGHVEKILRDGKSILVRLRTSRIHDDLFWDIPEEDIVQKLIETQKTLDKTLYLVPQQFLWAKRPEETKRSIIDWIFGERENPGRLRKNILFWRNYKSNAVCQFGEPLNLKDFIEAHPSIPNEEMSRILRSTLLSQIREERKRITGPALKPRNWMIENVLESKLVQEQIYNISADKGKDVEHVRTLALRYAKEITTDIDYSYIEFGNRILNWAFSNMYEGIHYNQEGLSNIKKISQRHPIVFVPTHRSHVDYLLLSNLLYQNDISVPHVAAGINLSFWPLGSFFRHCGAFFLRRTFAGNPLYKAVFEAYLQLLIKEGYCLEFFIEGGRSRTGKLRQPKGGMLSMITHLMQEGSTKELYFIPTSITYDNVIEQSSYVSECTGANKKREKFTDIFKLGKYLRRRYGKIYVNFGKPISFKQVAALNSPEIDEVQARNQIVENLSFSIMSSLNKHTTVVPLAIVSSALLMERRRGITSQQLQTNISILSSYAKHMNLKLADTLVTDMNRSVQEVLQRLSDQGMIEPHHDFDPVYYSIPEEMRPSLNYQKNSIIHFLLPIAYTTAAFLALMKQEKTTFKIKDVYDKIDFLKNLFANEFAASEGLLGNDKIPRTLMFLNQQGAIDFHPDNTEVSVTTLGAGILRQYKTIIDTFIDSYTIGLYTCSRISCNEPLDEKGLIKSMNKCGRHLLLLGKINHPEAILEPVFENVIKLLRKRNLLIKSDIKTEIKDRVKLCWNKSEQGGESLQQELELFL